MGHPLGGRRVRIRSIRPEFWSSEDVAAMDWPTRLIFIGLWSYVDDNGVGRDIERLIVTSLFPLDDDLTEASLNVHRALKHLNTRGHITRYEVENKPYLHVTNWTKHQRINRPSEGRYPLPTTANAEIHEPLTEDSLSTHADAPLGEGEKGRRGEGDSDYVGTPALRAVDPPDEADAQTLVAEWIGTYTSTFDGQRPPKNIIGMIGKQVKELLRDQPVEDVRAGLALWQSKGKLHPSTLPSVVMEARQAKADHTYLDRAQTAYDRGIPEAWV